MSSGFQKRMEMIIEVTSKGGNRLKGLKTDAEKVGAAMGVLTKGIEKNNMTTNEGKKIFGEFKGGINSLIKESDDLAKVQKKLAAASDKTKKSYDPGTVRELNKEVKRLKGNIMEWKDSLNQVVPGLVRTNVRTKGLVSNTGMLKTAMSQAGHEAKNFVGISKKKKQAIEKDEEATRKNSREVNRNTDAIKKNEFATNSLRQRVDTTGSTTFARFRRNIGALRNQILLLTFATASLRFAFNNAFDSANRLEASLKGLGAVATNTGFSFKEAEAAAVGMSSKGLLSIEDAAAGLKNLLSAGFGLPEATKMMNTLTDAASFNRQGTLALGQAVVGATQGIKNQNSIMVDNAGITKNLSIMYKEFAAANGLTAGSLDEAQKRQAIFNGILREGTIFAGDSTKVLNTMSGALTKLGVDSTMASAAVGELVTPMARGFVNTVQNLTSVFQNLADRTLGTESAMQKLYLIGFKIEDIFTKLSQVAMTVTASFAAATYGIGFLVGGMNSLVSFVNPIQGFTGAINVGMMELLAYVGVMKLFNSRTARAAKNLKKATASTKLVVATNKKLINSNMGVIRSMGMIGGISTQYKILKNNTQALGRSTQGLAVKFNLLGKSIARYAGAANLGVAATRLLTRSLLGLGKMFGFLIVFDLAFKALGRLSEMLNIGGVGTQIERTSERAKELLLATQAGGNAMNRAFDQSRITMGKFQGDLVKLTKLEQFRNVIQEKNIALQAALRKLQMANTQDAQAQAQVDVDYYQDQYDQAVQDFQSYNKKIIGENQKRLELLGSADVAYNEENAIRMKRAGVDTIIEARNTYFKRLADQKRFYETFNKLTKDTQDDPIYKQKQLNMDRAVEMAKQNIESIREQALAKHYSAMLAIREGYQRKMIEFDQDAIGRARRKLENERKDRLADAKKAYDDGLNLLKIYQEEFSKAYGQSVQGVIAASPGGQGTFGGVDLSSLPFKDFNEKALIDLRSPGQILDDGSFKNDRSFRLKEDFALYQDAFKQFDQLQKDYKFIFSDPTLSTKELNKEVQNYKQELAGMETVFTNLQSTLSPNIQNFTALGKAMKNNITAIQGINTTIGTTEEQYSQFLKDFKQGKIDVDELGKAYNETKQEIEKYIKAEMHRQTSAIQYKQDLKDMSVGYANLKAEFEGIMDATGAYTGLLAAQARQMDQAVEITEKYQFANTSLGDELKRGFLPFLFQSTKATQANAKAQDALANKQEIARMKQTAALNQAKGELKLEDDLMKKMENNKDKYHQDDIDRQDIRVKKANARIESILAEGKFLTWLQGKEKAVLDADQEGQMIRDKIEAYGQLVGFFANFANKMGDLESERLLANAKYQKTLNKEVMQGTLNQKQADTLALENAKLTAAEKTKNEKLYLANLIRDIGRQVMVYAARAAAEKGKIKQALVYLAAGAVANMALNRYANRITREAELGYAGAQEVFERREAEIRGEGDNQAGSANEQRFGGSIKAQNLSVEINPTVVIQGEQVFIGQGSVNEFGAELQSLLLTSVNDAIENREIDLSNVSDRG